jgi:hypothetical protein
MHTEIAAVSWNPASLPTESASSPGLSLDLAGLPVQPCARSRQGACFAHRLAVLADLTRVQGIGDATAELMMLAGVDLPYLRSRKAEKIARRLAEVNELLKVVARTPSLDRIRQWQKRAKALTPLVRR